MKSTFHFDLITNSTNITLESELDFHLQGAQEVCIASAFINQGAVEHLINYLENRKQKTKFLRLLVGLYGRFNSPQILSELMRIQNRYSANCQIRIAVNERFHWKCYLLDTGKKQISFVGSANFTSNGISESGEMVVRVVENEKNGFSKRGRDEFNKIFDNAEESFSILQFPLEKYKSLYKPQPYYESNSDTNLSELLKKPLKPKSAIFKSYKGAKVRLLIQNGYMKVNSVKIVSKYKSEWERLSYDYSCFDSKRNYIKACEADLILYRERNNEGNWAYTFYQVMDKTEISTPDGKYFIAYKKVKGSLTRKQSIIIKKLEELNISVSKRGTAIDRNLTRKQSDELMKDFRIK